MVTKKQLAILEVFVKQPFREYTRKEIKEGAHETSNNTLALTINRFKKEGVISEKIIGRSGLLSLNVTNDLTYYYLALCNLGRIHPLARLSVESLKKEISTCTPFYSVVIFGSYAVGEQKKTSDLDVAVFIEHKIDQKKIEAVANSAKLKSVLEMDIHIISRSEMLEMLTSTDENLGKQIARKNLAMHNHKIFYDILMEGMNHGFRI